MSTSYFLGLLADTMGEPRRRVLHFEAALDRTIGAGARLFTARVQYAYARLLLSGPECAPGRAAELLDEALLAARELGMGRLARRISELKP